MGGRLKTIAVIQARLRSTRLPGKVLLPLSGKAVLEHVTHYIKNHPSAFSLKNVANADNLAHMRWTLDQAEDYAFLRKIFGALHRKKKMFGMKEISGYLGRHPEVERLNRHIERNAG